LKRRGCPRGKKPRMDTDSAETIDVASLLPMSAHRQIPSDVPSSVEGRKECCP
jgi:hypothetical protein